MEETLAGRSDQISEYNLGVRVFNRGLEFNPRLDPIVRVQTHHLRSRLAQYYATAGATDPVVIELPARKYVPVFRMAEQPAPVVVEATPAPPVEAVEPAPVRSHRGPVVAGALIVFGAVALVGLVWRSVQPPVAQAHRHEPAIEAQDLYIRGRYLLDRQSESALRRSIDSFQQATARDPQFAAAFAGIADANNMLVQYGFMPPREGMEAARRAARHALQLDPKLAEAYVSLAAITEAYDWNFQEAEKQYRRAIELNPSLPAAHLWYGMFLRDQGRVKEALPELRRAEDLEPISILASINLAYTLRMAGDSAGALEHAKRAVELNPELPSVDVMLANLYRSRSEIGNADDTLARARSLSDGNPHALALVACTYAKLGRRVESAGLLRDMEALSKQRYVSPYDLGNVAWTLGEEDRAVTWFEEAFRERSTGVVFLLHEKQNTRWQSPRMQSLIKRMGNG